MPVQLKYLLIEKFQWVLHVIEYVSIYSISSFLYISQYQQLPTFRQTEFCQNSNFSSITLILSYIFVFGKENSIENAKYSREF